MRAGGQIVRDEEWKAFGNEHPLELPAELRFENLAGGTKVEVSLEAHTGHFSTANPLVVRDASTHFVEGKTLLLRTRLEQECIPSFRLAGDLTTPTCDPPTTCIAAACADPYVHPSLLEDYSPTWADVFADACKPAAPAEPVVVIGGGQTSFQPLAAGDVVQVEGGPQGGFHVWLSIRMKNLHQAGTTTSVAVYEMGATEPLGTFVSAQSYSRADEGFCDLLGMRCQLTLKSAFDDQNILGDSMQVVVRVADESGDLGVGEQILTLSDNVVKE
ncbi:MAG: hypothetical protein HUU21_16255 [Polyangiaceae bacterium]|nr:hypothetical protein [Polyangiaceae bacterium]